MKSSQKSRFFSTSSYASVTYTIINKKDDQNTPPSQVKTAEIPVECFSDEVPVPIDVHLPASLQPSESSAAVKIQSAYRAHMIRTLVKRIRAVNKEADRLQKLIQRQETVDAIRSDEREKVRMNEALMALLLRLDSVPGIYPAVREIRRAASRRVVGLQEILDAVADARVHDADGFLTNWDQMIADMEEDVCLRRGGEEMERFCAEKLGFRCFERFLRGV
ncbi:BAG family molecular chaperone regulator 5, mitochondrial isoform X2 [Telopea speciosissima]|uniref:BAG family molecular chaperone regulator 5, mitochondrial isoform X1 n=1 Tax=Telopea speciosissima TaxID=54955 RepID=UPI001CC3D8A7|nr:BAG family molecular chaperone regulator 5, mitochondrial isoform X1 [Telopea speciosissima]XP_043690779.1 BAG family molecular chaperone regulator 5, mitochondrial isoform X2 [Telopea speciosissima]